MRIGLQAFGTRGDIAPFLALAGGLSKAGHNVTLLATTLYVHDYTPYEEFYNIKIIPGATPAMQTRWCESLYPNAEEGEIGAAYKELSTSVYKACEELCINNDVIIGLEGEHYLQAYTELHDKHFVSLSYQPYFTPSKYKPFLELHDNIWNENSYTESWKTFEEYYNNAREIEINEFRQKIGLHSITEVFKEVHHSKELQILCISKAFCEQYPDWENHRYVCGYFLVEDLLDAPVILQPLQDFINKGDSPLFFTLGSQNLSNHSDNRVQIIKDVIVAAKAVKKRVIIQSNWNTVSEFDIKDDESIFKLNQVVDYRDILPQCTAMIHHGGSGTTHIATLCGCPSLVIETGNDTPIWAYFLNHLGMAPEKILLDEVNSLNLIDRLETILKSNDMKRNAVSYSEVMKSENGVKTAVEIISKKYAHLN